MIRGRVVREADASPVVGALVEAYPAFRSSQETRTDEHGEFAGPGLPQGTHTNATNRSSYSLVEYLTISAPGIARTLVDPCSDAPWAAPIRVRATGTVSGRIADPPPGQRNHVVVVAPWRDLCWPPRTGMTHTEQRWLCDLDAEGRFEIRDVPAEVPLDLQWNAGTTGDRGIQLVTQFVLASGATREFELTAPAEMFTHPLRPAPRADVPTSRSDATGDAWITISPRAWVRDGAITNRPAFEIVEGGRHQPHRVGGGRWHVHGWRACDHLEVLTGSRTLVAFDARGQIGLERFEVQAIDGLVAPRVEIAPGALLRIAFDGPEERARITLSSQGIEFRSRDLPRGAVWYELAPAGKVSVRVTNNGADPRSIEVDARAGQIERVEL